LVTALSEPEKVFALVSHAQGCIDNGGLSYFFEHGETVPYAAYVGAYRTIGVPEVADCLGNAVAAFGLREPHLEREARLDWITENNERERLDETWEVANDMSETVWARLAAYSRLELSAEIERTRGWVLDRLRVHRVTDYLTAQHDQAVMKSYRNLLTVKPYAKAGVVEEHGFFRTEREILSKLLADERVAADPSFWPVAELVVTDLAVARGEPPY
jgi:hypothetical protein